MRTEFTDRDWARGVGSQFGDAMTAPDKQMKPPDYHGPLGKAWRMKLVPPEKLKHKDWLATLAGWLVTVPSAHPAWHSYMACLIHLRDIPGVKPAVKQSPDNTHEFMIYALNPGEDLPDPDTVMEDGRIHMLTPVNLVYQFGGLSDDQAKELLEELVRAYTDGLASPDTDYNFHTRRLLRNTIEHIALGTHPKEIV